MPPRAPRRAVVVATEQLTPHMIRIVFGGPDFDDFEAGAFTDHYVKLRLPDREGTIRTRTYTVREWDAERHELTVDFVVHGDTGVAGPWAAAAQPGDEIDLGGPGGAYTPDPDADWHLLAGDASVIPAISAALPRIPAGVPVHVVIEIDGEDERQPLRLPRRAAPHLAAPLRGRPARSPSCWPSAVSALDLPDGRGHAFVHGEASSVRNLRRHLIAERGLAPESLSISGYWKLKRTEEGWREDKAEWSRLVEADLAA